MDKTILFKLESKSYEKIEIISNDENNIFELKEFSKNIQTNFKVIESQDIKFYIENKKKDGFYDFESCFSDLDNVDVLEDKFFGYILRCPEFGIIWIAKYLEVFNLTVEISLDNNYDTSVIYEDVIETYKYFVENQVKLIEYLKLNFWGDLLSDLYDFYDAEKEIYEDQINELKKYPDYEMAIWRKKECELFFERYERANKIDTEHDNINLKLELLDEFLKVTSIEINRINEDDPIDTKYGEIWVYFSYKLDEEHGTYMILKNGGL